MKKTCSKSDAPTNTGKPVDNWRDPTDYQRVLMAHRIVQAGILISLLWKWEFFIYANNVYHSIEVVDVFFPAALRSAFVLKVTFLGTVGAGSLSLLATSSSIRRAGNLISLAGLCVLCTHQGSYNDVTFFTTWWCTVWTWWLGNRIDHDDPAELLTKAAFVARAIISMIMLGGAVGKWTEEYWSGQVLFDIYFADRDYWVFNYLRDQYTSEQLQMIAKWYSRNVVVVESLAGLFYWLLPNRLAATVGAILLLSIALSSNLLLFSVLGCLISLAMVGFLPRKLPSTSQTDS